MLDGPPNMSKFITEEYQNINSFTIAGRRKKHAYHPAGGPDQCGNDPGGGRKVLRCLPPDGGKLGARREAAEGSEGAAAV